MNISMYSRIEASASGLVVLTSALMGGLDSNLEAFILFGTL